MVTFIATVICIGNNAQNHTKFEGIDYINRLKPKIPSFGLEVTPTFIHHHSRNMFFILCISTYIYIYTYIEEIKINMQNKLLKTLLFQNTEVLSKWPTFRNEIMKSISIRDFTLYFDPTVTEFVLKGPTDNKAVPTNITVWRRTGNVEDLVDWRIYTSLTYS